MLSFAIWGIEGWLSSVISYHKTDLYSAASIYTFLFTGAIHFDTGANQNIKLLRLPAALLGGCVAVLVIHSRIRFWVTTYIDFVEHLSMNLQ